MKDKTQELERTIHRIQARVRFYKILCLILCLLGIAFFFRVRTSEKSSRPSANLAVSRIASLAPRHAEIQKIIEPLDYTFMPVLNRPGMRLEVDLERDLWYLRGIHLFDEKGQVRLEGGRSGLCGDLAAYTYQQVKPLLEKDYQIRFVRAAESHFFPAPLNIHYVLSIIDRTNPERIFILDPTFRRYGPLEDFEDYLFFEHLPVLQFMKTRNPDNVELVNRAIPVLIQEDVKLSLMIRAENGRFNEQNYGVAILATQRNTYMPRTAYRISMVEGKEEIQENPKSAEGLKHVAEYHQLKEIARSFFEQMRQQASARR